MQYLSAVYQRRKAPFPWPYHLVKLSRCFLRDHMFRSHPSETSRRKLLEAADVSRNSASFIFNDSPNSLWLSSKWIKAFLTARSTSLDCKGYTHTGAIFPVILVLALKYIATKIGYSPLITGYCWNIVNDYFPLCFFFLSKVSPGLIIQLKGSHILLYFFRYKKPNPCKAITIKTSCLWLSLCYCCRSHPERARTTQ